jgi:hypothetical protein
MEAEVNDPGVLKWLDTKTGQKWLNAHHHRNAHYDSWAQIKDVTPSSFDNWRWTPVKDGEFVSAVLVSAGFTVVHVVADNSRVHP